MQLTVNIFGEEVEDFHFYYIIFELYEKIITWLGHSFYPLGAL